MTNEMIERVAKATYENYFENLIGELEPSWEELPEDAKDRLRYSIKCGIKAMREPTEDQYNALCATDKMWKELDSKTVWQTYIDAVLK